MLLFGLAFGVVALACAFVLTARRPSRAARPNRTEILMVYLSSAWALLVSVLLLFVPTYTHEYSSISTHDGITTRTPTVTRGETLLAVNGLGALVPLILVVITASLPLLFRNTRWRAVLEAVAAVLLVGFTMVTGFWFYLPSAVAMLTAAVLACTTKSFGPPGSPGLSA